MPSPMIRKITPLNWTLPTLIQSSETHPPNTPFWSSSLTGQSSSSSVWTKFPSLFLFLLVSTFYWKNLTLIFECMNCEKACFVPWLTLIIVLSVANLMMDSSRCPACRNYKVQMVIQCLCLVNLCLYSKCRLGTVWLCLLAAALWKSRKALQWTRRCTSWPRFNGPSWLRSKGTYLRHLTWGIEYWMVWAVYMQFILIGLVVFFLAAQMNVKLCDKFSITHYPVLFWGPPRKFVGGSWGPKQDKSEIILMDDWRTSDLLLSWINKQIGRWACIESFFILHWSHI